VLLAGAPLTGHKVAAALSQVVAERVAPGSITADNGSEFVSRAMEAWAYQYGVQLDFIRPGRPVENSYIEFNGRLRDECLNVEVFFTLTDVREKLERWRKDNNQVRPHSALNDHSPQSFATTWAPSAASAKHPLASAPRAARSAHRHGRVVEAGGIEPPSEDRPAMATTRLVRALELAARPPTDRLSRSQPV